MTVCTRCENTGFLNIDHVDEAIISIFEHTGNHAVIISWIKANDNHDCQVCDCCGDGEYWHGYPGLHYGRDDPKGDYGPYAYNGGLCECD